MRRTGAAWGATAWRCAPALHDRLLGTARTSLRGQEARQDDPNDPTTSTYRRTLTVPANTRKLDITVDGLPGTDLDLWVFYDFDGNGSFDFPFELVAVSGSPTADEQVRLLGDLPAGQYQIWVHGWYVPAGVTRFSLETATTTGQVWPDVVPADFDAALADSPAALSAAVLRRTPPPVTGAAARGGPQPVFPFGQEKPVTTGRGELRAGLITVHGMTRLFFRYFPVVGDGIDGRLQETLGAVDSWNGTDRRAAQRILRRFGEVLHDGHQFVFDLGPQTFAGFLPVFLEEVDGRPVIRRSAIDELHPGDTILAMNGRPIEDIYAEEYARTSAATGGYRFDLASRQVSRLGGPTEVLLADPDGAERTVTVQPQPPEVRDEATLPGVSDRPSGPLTDLGAPGLYYLNLDTETSTSMAQVRAALADATARQSSGLVLDMRGYPGGANHYEVAARLIRQPFLSPIFDNNVFEGPDTLTRSPSQYLLFPEPAPAWDGPIVLLTGPHAVSAAENFMQMLVGADRLTAVVGQRSAGTNGNITGVQLPGGFEFLYTGMEVRNVDGSTFHGVGITPDIEVPLTAADLRDGIDRDILTAIDVLTP